MHLLNATDSGSSACGSQDVKVSKYLNYVPQLPHKQEIYPSVLSANLKTMGLSFEDLRLWLSRKG